MIERITLLGSSSGRNAGDAALISGIMESIDTRFGQGLLYDIPTIKPNFIKKTYPNRTCPVSMLPWGLSVKMLGVPTFRSIMRSDLSLIFDAILFDRALYNPLFNFLSTLYLMLPYAKKKGKKLGFFNVGAGPVNTKTGKMILREISELMDFITVRDEDSYNILRGIGVQNPRILVTADAALNVTPCSKERAQEIIKTSGLLPGEETLAINISAYIDSWAAKNSEPLGKERFLEILSRAINSASQKIGAQILIVCTQHHDVPLSKELLSRIDKKLRVGLVDNITHNHFEIQGVLGEVSLLFGMRLHATILAASMLTPITALPHQPKVNHFFRSLGLEKWSIGFDNLTPTIITDLLLDGWSQRKHTKQLLTERIPILKKRASLASELVYSLAYEKDLNSEIQRLQAPSSNVFSYEKCSKYSTMSS